MAKFNIHSFISNLTEATEAQSPADKEFEALHPVDKKQFVAYPEHQFKGTTKKDESKEAHMSNTTGMEDDVEKEKPLGEEVLEEGSMDKMSLSDLMKRHAEHHENGGGSDRSYKAMGAIETHVKKKYGEDALKKLHKSTENHALNGGHGMSILRGIKEHEDLPTFEEIAEQNLQELSKKTLGSYIKKAARDHGTSKRYEAQLGRDYHDVDKNKGGPEVEKAKATYRDLGTAEADRARQRLRGISKATDKLTKEEVEQIDELSKETLRAYIDKSSKDLNKRTFSGHGGEDPSKVDRRASGLERAVKRVLKK